MARFVSTLEDTPLSFRSMGYARARFLFLSSQPRDGAGRFWLFGGDLAGNFSTLASNLWRWDGTAWTWVSGSNLENHPGNYGTLGAGAATNVPGARAPATWWTDPARRFWLFGGYGRSDASTGYLADLWKWTGSAWAWIGGSDLDQAGSYVRPGVRSQFSVIAQ